MKICALAVFALALSAPWCFAHEFLYETTLSGLAESPSNGSPGTGSGSLLLDLDLITMQLHIDFSGLSGTTTGGHIRCCTSTAGTGTSIVATMLPSLTGFPLGVTSGSWDTTIDIAVPEAYNPAFITASGGTTSDALNALIFGLADGKAYWEIETTASPAGEIRGFLVGGAVEEPSSTPEPATAFAAAGALSGFVILRTFRRR